MDHNSKIFGNRPITNMDHEEKRGPRSIRSDIRVHAPTCSDPSHFWTDTRTIFYIPVSGSVKNELSCYQCASSSLSECRKEEYLTPCPNDHAVDTCQSVISKRCEYPDIQPSLMEGNISNHWHLFPLPFSDLGT